MTGDGAVRWYGRRLDHGRQVGGKQGQRRRFTEWETRWGRREDREKEDGGGHEKGDLKLIQYSIKNKKRHKTKD
jgi:hypothetical protein